jgi:hypothetical protein
VYLPYASHISRNMAEVSVSAGRLTAGAAAIHTRGVVLGAIPLDGSSDDATEEQNSAGKPPSAPVGMEQIADLSPKCSNPAPGTLGRSANDA